MFMGPFEQTISWNTDGLVGMRRFLERVWKVVNKIIYDKKKLKNKKSKFIHKTIKKITEDIENFKFNTAIAALIIQFNGLNGKPDWRGKLSRGEWESEEFDFDALENFLILLSPFAPHISEELWQKLDHKKSIFEEEWPKYNPELIREEKINLIIQINGKVRDQIEVDAEILEQEAKEIALSQEKVVKWIKGKEIKKVIFVKGKLINIVV
jgi:leucyl-tRNA synthetase